jgi:predicted ATP-dependent endonuclease of OLD family
MKFAHFKFENFKGIEKQILNLEKSNSSVYALVGLNESGKTTILEAINYFKYKRESLDALELDNYTVEDIHDLIPINKRDNFNGRIQIEACIVLENEDKTAIRDEFRKNNIYLVECGDKVTYTQNYIFENSENIPSKNEFHWDNDFKARIGKSRKIEKLKNKEALLVNGLIKSRMPSILYFPNFLFEFPERIYLNESVDEPKHKFYQQIIQDVLDSLDNDLNIKDHLLKRIESTDDKDKRSLNSLIGKMQRQLTEIIFDRWNLIFKREISKTEIVLIPKKDDFGSYLEFNIKDDVDTYRLIERSLGFRWFFVYILLTQFRSYRKENKNAIFLFDEPASNLHPSAQTQLLKSFEKLPNVIYTTHSHYLINAKWLESTFVVKNEAIDYNNEIKCNSKNTNIKIYRYREFASKHPNQSSYFQPILELLDYRPTNLELTPKVILTEGKNDFYTYSYLRYLLSHKTKLHIVPGTSSSNMESLISLYLGWGTKFIILLDSDKEGLKQKERYENLFGFALANSLFTYADIDSNWKNFETENLFSSKDLLAIQKLKYDESIKFDKKIFNRSLQELCANHDRISIDAVTSDNFNKVFDFFNERLK